MPTVDLSLWTKIFDDLVQVFDQLEREPDDMYRLPQGMQSPAAGRQVHRWSHTQAPRNEDQLINNQDLRKMPDKKRHEGKRGKVVRPRQPSGAPNSTRRSEQQKERPVVETNTKCRKLPSRETRQARSKRMINYTLRGPRGEWSSSPADTRPLPHNHHSFQSASKLRGQDRDWECIERGDAVEMPFLASSSSGSSPSVRERVLQDVDPDVGDFVILGEDELGGEDENGASRSFFGWLTSR